MKVLLFTFQNFCLVGHELDDITRRKLAVGGLERAPVFTKQKRLEGWSAPA